VSGGKQRRPAIDSPDAARPFFDALKGESDRAAAVLAAAFLESALEELLRKAIVPNASKDLFRSFGPLSSFGGKIDVSHALGLINDEERDDLRIVKSIRNDFAHDADHALSFASGAVKDRVMALWHPAFLEEFHEHADGPRFLPNSSMNWPTVRGVGLKWASARSPGASSRAATSAGQ
jgi:hypothetical protein